MMTGEWMDETRETRIRIGVKQTAKGSIQLDLTSEAPSVAEAIKGLSESIDQVRATVSEKGLVLAGSE